MGKRLINSSFYSNYSFEYEKVFELEKKEVLIHNLFCFLESLEKEIQFNSFEIGFSWPKNKDISIEFKYSVRDRLIDLLINDLNKKHETIDYDAFFLIDLGKSSLFLYLMPVYIQGNYCKFSREIAQTEHFCRFCHGRGCSKCGNSGHIIENSVEQLLSKIIVKEFGAKQLILHGAGREDSDVLMLGKGRPFILEIVCPKKRFVDLNLIQEKVNNSLKEISINSLKIVSKKDVVVVKNSVHDKIYSAIIYCSENLVQTDISKINTLLNKKMCVEQLTPVRVQKRRALLNRKKEVTFLSFKKINDNEFELKMRTSHGTYVKEFISGDEERTKPSLNSIINKNCVCKQLDVIEICDLD